MKPKNTFCMFPMFWMFTTMLPTLVARKQKKKRENNEFEDVEANFL